MLNNFFNRKMIKNKNFNDLIGENELLNQNTICFNNENIESTLVANDI